MISIKARLTMHGMTVSSALTHFHGKMIDAIEAEDEKAFTQKLTALSENLLLLEQVWIEIKENPQKKPLRDKFKNFGGANLIPWPKEEE